MIIEIFMKFVLIVPALIFLSKVIENATSREPDNPHGFHHRFVIELAMAYFMIGWILSSLFTSQIELDFLSASLCMYGGTILTIARILQIRLRNDWRSSQIRDLGGG